MSCGLYRLAHLVSDIDAIEVYKTKNEIEKLLYQGNKLPDTWAVAKINYLIAKHYMNAGKPDKAMEHIKLCYDGAMSFDNHPDEMKFNSLFWGEKTVRRSDFDTADSRTLCDIVCDSWLTDKEFDRIRKTEEFTRIFIN